MDDFQTTTSSKKGGHKKDFKETPLPSVLDEQRAVNKKKKKEAATFIYGGAAKELLGEAGEEEKQAVQEEKESEQKQEDQESDEEESKGKGKDKHRKKMEQKKKGKGGNKKKKGGAESSDEDEAGGAGEEEEEKVPAATKKAAKQGAAPELTPIDVIYCRVCGIPPEYCMFDKKDSSECKDWLRKTHPELFQQIYNEEAIVTAEGAAEETKDDAQKKKKKKVSIAPSGNQDVKIYKAKRGGRKMICSVTGLQAYGVPLKDIAKLMSKKFSCGANVTDDEKYGECIQIQGDIEEKFMEFAEKELAKYKIPIERIKFEEIKKKKKAEGEPAGDDGEDDA